MIMLKSTTFFKLSQQNHQPRSNIVMICLETDFKISDIAEKIHQDEANSFEK